ncbi:MAG: hypothetical protein WB297_04020 [Actinomycetota bacterium]
MTEKELARGAAHRLAIIRHAHAVTGNVSVLRGVVIGHTELFNDKLQEWERFYSFNRPHGALGGQTPCERLRTRRGPERERTP